MRTTLTLAITLGLAAGANAEAPKRGKNLEAGEVLITTKKIGDSPIPQARVRALVDAPVETVWALVSDCDNYKKNMVRVESAKKLWEKGEASSPDGAVVVCTTTIDMPFPLANLTSKTAGKHTIKDGVYRRAWKLLKGDYHSNTGSWTIKKYKGTERTLVEYKIHAVPKIPVPAFLQEAAQASSLPDLIGHLRMRAKAYKASK